PALKNPGIVIVTDRTALDRQISGVFKACGHTVERADKVRTLHEMLRSPIGRTVTTTIQKFQELREELGSQPG
ncbi:MAG: hypothetical protein KC431_11165, partial [Myxococcales bacterium]|nr:hypothetical protein [Myxococcales bacterium]